MSEKAVVLLSGGVDSAVCMANAIRKEKEVYSVYSSYGQRADNFSIGMAQEQHSYWGLDTEHWYKLGLADTYGEICGRNGGCGIIGDEELENEDGSVVAEDGRGLQYVPMRNLMLLTQAGALADAIGADEIHFGAQAWNEDVAPDARPEFVEAAQKALTLSMADDDDIIVRTPILQMSKTQVVEWGEELGVPWRSTWSCYEMPDNWEHPTPCGKCHSCKERAKAFRDAEVEDPHETPEIVPEDEQGVQT